MATVTEAPIAGASDPFANMRKTALPSYDWLANKTVNLVTDRIDVQDCLRWMKLVVRSSRRKPALVALDIETHGPPGLWDEAVQRGAEVHRLKALRDALPSKKKRTPAQQAEWDNLATAQKLAEVLADDASVRARRSGLIAGLNKVRLVQLYAGGRNVWTLDLMKLDDAHDVRALLKALIYRSDIQWIGHNIQFDVAMLYAATCGPYAPADES